MKKSKKVILFVLTMALVMSMTVSGIVTANAAENTTADKYVEYQVGLLEALRISKTSGVGITDWTGNLTRGEAAFLIAGLLRLDRSKRDTIFNDVSIEAYYAGSIDALYDEGIILKNWGSLKYKPDEEITYVDFVAMICRALGYMGYAESKGGYPTGYIAVARQFKITTGVSGTASTYMSKKDVPQLLINALDATYLGVSMIDSEGNQLSTKQGVVLEDYFGVEKYRGIVNEVGPFSVTQNFLTTSTEINVGGYNFNIKKAPKEYYDVLGQDVYVYYYTDNKQAVAVCPTKNNNTLEIDAQDIKSHSSADLLEYYEGDSVKKAKLDISRTVLNNGVKDNTASIVPTYGKIQLVDNDNDNKYDIIKVASYKAAVIKNTDSINSIITFDDDVSVDIDNDEISLTITGADGKTLKKSALKKDIPVLYSASANSKIFDILVLNVAVDGTVTTKGDEEIAIDGTSYPLSDLVIESGVSYKLRDSVTVYTDIQGRVVYIKVAGYDPASAYYAIYLDCIQTKSGSSPRWELELFTQQGAYVSAPVAEKVLFNGQKKYFKDVQATVAATPYEELIKFNMMDGEITEIYTVTDWGNTYKVWERGKYFNKYTPNYASTYMFRTETGGEFDRWLPIASGAVRFYIAHDEFGKFDPEKSRASTTKPANDKWYSGVKLYDIGLDGKANAYIVASADNLNLAGGSGKRELFVVDRLVRGVDDEENDGVYVFGYLNGQEQRFFINSENYEALDITISNSGVISSPTFSHGNMVRISVAGSEIVEYFYGAGAASGRKIYYTKDELTALNYGYGTTKETNAYMDSAWLGYCTIARLVFIENGRAFFSHESTIGNAITKNKCFSVPVAGAVYKYDTTSEDMITTVSWNDLVESDISSADSEVTGSIVLINVNSYNTTEVFVLN